MSIMQAAGGAGLEESLVKHVSQLEKAKLAAKQERSRLGTSSPAKPPARWAIALHAVWQGICKFAQGCAHALTAANTRSVHVNPRPAQVRFVHFHALAQIIHEHTSTCEVCWTWCRQVLWSVPLVSLRLVDSVSQHRQPDPLAS